MRKKLILTAAAVLLSASLSLPAFAAEWKSDAAGWWYQNDDGTYPNNGWTWIDGKCYYFTPDGYCLINTQTPDGYTVDASGAWVVDGVVQTQGEAQAGNSQAAGGSVVQWNGLTFTVPDGFVQDTSQQEGICFVNQNRTTAIKFESQELPGMEEYAGIINVMQEQIFDEAVEEYVGTPSSKSPKQFTTGVWYCYEYADASYFGISGSMRIYLRMNGAALEMVMFAGNLAGLDPDGIMNANLR